ncbi:MAG: hypothetical protein Q9188_003595 [Gyalolechia gomerana]
MKTLREKKFRAVVVGGGVTGLVAAHAFTKAGIDPVVLERGGEAAPPTGASITIYPHGARILQRLGLLERTQNIADPFEGGVTNRWPDGTPIQWSDLWRFVRENHGAELMLLERRGYLEVLWENLPDKSKVLFNKKVTDIVEDNDGIEVFLSDGTSERGDIVVGADGVHSTVREKMWEHANRLEPGIIDVKKKKDAEEMAASVADMPISETMVFGELWKKRWRGSVVDIEEGIFSRWHYGRTLLVGDTAHKITPILALGGNSGMESVVVLTNLLHANLSAADFISPSRHTLNCLFQRYQDQRLPRMKHIMEFSRLITRTQAWDNWILKMVSIWVLPYLPQRKLANDLEEIIRKAPMLDFVPLGEWKQGRLEWEDMKLNDGREGEKKDLVPGLKGLQAKVLMATALVLSSLLWVLSAKGFVKWLVIQA